MGIELAGIQKSYKEKRVLESVSLKAGEGKCIGILGGNGCGKSTLLSILAGVRKADGGSFLYQGKDLLQDHGFRTKTLGYVPQGNPLFEELTAWDNLRLWHDRRTLKKELTDGVLALLGIDGFLKVPVRKMSGGMKKRLSLGCVVVSRPKILLLDEPTSALDLACKGRIRDYLERYRMDGGIILLTTHDMQEMEFCNECYILKQGILTPYAYDGDIRRLERCL
ncbi:MAG: ABC transporter ATP-binding protein [Lachnospiraceae bacterium]|nr:ABC transporter ATP-binding protein [Butyrivibrio sp.]MCM1343626.1 ABC transporter ATP-binding protein [Muribaculaceae bacterium]MCM1410783.1 ABC transporter ATP-binding protein [Lachnospiraceae bacterium]